MNRINRKWTSLTIAIIMLVTLMLPMSAYAAGPRIDITSPLAEASAVDPSVPNNVNQVPRFTTSAITLTAGIQNIADSQIPGIYYEIVNIKTNPKNNVTTVVKSNPAQHTSGAFSIQFNNVSLSEGLNKITIKMGTSSVVSSAPTWAYFTPTTSITNLTVDELPFMDTTSYPVNPSLRSAVTISGQAPNATSVEVTVGNSAPKAVFLSNGKFFFTADSKVNSTSSFRVNAGDNPITIVAKNSDKTYQIKKNLLYDDGRPYAFNAAISTKSIATDVGMEDGEQITSFPYTLIKPNVAIGTIEIWDKAGKAGARIPATDYTIKTDTAGLTSIDMVDRAGLYVYYSYNNTPLLTIPTTETTNVGISANLKVDLLPTKTLKYRFVDVLAGNKRFGPYDLAKSNAATTASNNGLFPAVVNEGYSDMIIGIQGTGLNSPGNSLHVKIENKSGSIVNDAEDLTQASPHSFNKAGTMAFFNLTKGTLTKRDSPYKVIISNGNNVLNTYSLTVNNNGSLEEASVVDLTVDLKEGYTAEEASQSVLISGTPEAAKLRIEITDITGQTGYGKARGEGVSANSVQYTLPAGIDAGLYKMKVFYNEIELTQRLINILAPDPTPPVFTKPSAVQMVNIPTGAQTPTYFTVQGRNLGNDIKRIISVDLVESISGSTNSASLSAVYVNGSTAIFKIDDVQSLDDGETYNLSIKMELLNSEGDVTQSDPMIVENVIKAKQLVTSAQYVDEAVSGMYPTGTATPIELSQVDKADLATTTLTIEGENLQEFSKLSIQILNLVTGVNAVPGYLATSASGDSAIAKIPTTLNAGTYLVRLVYSGTVLGQYPLVVGGANLTSLNPSLTYVGDGSTSLDVTGTGFGFNPEKLKLKFVSDSTGQITTEGVQDEGLISEKQAIFRLANLPEGNYTVSVLYNLVPGGTTLKYTVAPAQPSLQENAALSISDRYRVFNFSAGVQIPTDRDQIVQFKFYNFTTDVLPPTTFSYHYVDSSLAYIQSAMIGNSQQLSELSSNSINEMPTKLVVYANEKTERVNLYIGEYTNASKPTQTVDTEQAENGLRRAEFDLSSLPNGATKFTVIPSNVVKSTDSGTLGENFSGRRIYDISVTSTPYMIVNNIYTGLVVKDPLSEIVCNTEGHDFISACISGRFVNVPLTDLDWATVTQDGTPKVPDVNVEMYVNGSKTDITLAQIDQGSGVNPEFDADYGYFGIEIPANGVSGNRLDEGKNVISFLIYFKGVLQTKTSYDVFVFTTSAPEFTVLKPIDSDIPKYIPGTLADTYATAETAIAFSGQFFNATDLKLTVLQKDEFGNQTSVYDRRVSNGSGAGFTSYPETDNPGYLLDVNLDNDNPPLSFTTERINLALKGDTIFEFAITNSSNVVITRSITITREPMSYVLIYPILTKNSSGKEQANINSNFIEIEMAAEGADSVNFGGKTDAVKRTVKDINNNDITHFFHEVSDLKAGANTIKFTVVRGTLKTSGTFILFNSNTTVEGEQYKSPLKTSLKIFNNELELKFPTGTNLMRNEPTALEQYLTTDRKILFGIANDVDGRVDKYKNPAVEDFQIDNPNPTIPANGKLMLEFPNNRFRAASKLFWIDAGTIPSVVTDKAEALSGSGKLPYDAVDFFSRELNDLVVPTKRGTLTLKYDPSIRTDAWKYITVYHYDNYEDYTGSVNYRWRNMGGVVDTTKNTVTVPFDTFGYYQVMYMNQSFDDITTHSWARNQLDTLYSKGIMVNKDKDDFVPNANITRGEFSTLLVKIFDIPLQYTEVGTFDDVERENPTTNGMYDYRYIETAAKVGIVRGSGGRMFLPGELITRQDAAVMIARAANLKLNASSEKSLVTLQKVFTDASGIDLYARTAVEAVNKAALIEGKANILIQGQKKLTYRFDPAQTFTRAEAAEVAIRVLKQQKKIPK